MENNTGSNDSASSVDSSSDGVELQEQQQPQEQQTIAPRLTKRLKLKKDFY